MICKSCGKTIPEGSKFCTFCGANQITAVPASEPAAKAAAAPARKRKTGLIVTICAIITVIALTLLTIFVIIPAVTGDDNVQVEEDDEKKDKNKSTDKGTGTSDDDGAYADEDDIAGVIKGDETRPTYTAGDVAMTEESEEIKYETHFATVAPPTEAVTETETADTRETEAVMTEDIAEPVDTTTRNETVAVTTETVMTETDVDPEGDRVPEIVDNGDGTYTANLYNADGTLHTSAFYDEDDNLLFVYLYEYDAYGELSEIIVLDENGEEIEGFCAE